MSYPGKEAHLCRHKESLRFGQTMRVTGFLSSLMSVESIHRLDKLVLKPLLNFKKEFELLGKTFNLSFRGSVVPIAFSPPELSLGSRVKDNEFTKLTSAIFSKLNLTSFFPFMFLRNADLDIELVEANELKEILAHLKNIEGFECKQIEPFLYQFTSAKFPAINVNLKNSFVINPEEASIGAGAVNFTGEPFPRYYVGLKDEKRFHKSYYLDASRVPLIAGAKESDESMVFLREDSRQILFGGEPDIFHVDNRQPFGVIIADVSRWVRLLGTTYGTSTLEKSLNENNIRKIENTLQARIKYDFNNGVSASYDRATFIGNMITLLLSNPEAFALVVERMPFIFSASRMFGFLKMNNDVKKELGIAVTRKNIDDIFNIIQDNHHKSNEILYNLTKRVDELVKTIPERLIHLIPDIVRESGTTYTMKEINSLIGLLLMFDTSDTTGEPYALDRSFFDTKTEIVYYRNDAFV